MRAPVAAGTSTRCTSGPGWWPGPATPEEMEKLELPAGEPVMILKRRTFTKDGVPIEFARGVHAASRFEWSYSFPLPD
ncbi:UTRA domain-containing protein [Saccharothrix xinjiangensis]|uniref:UTRA domain-containing protein n=1 Tax=Saccharothrix xinjiangensis TaxID=204798 RepID=A0ABV9XU46_9PSEU